MRLMRVLGLAAGLALAGAAMAYDTVDGDYIVKNYSFTSGEKMPEVRLHYTTLGKLQKDAKGHATNVILLLHGTGGDGKSFLRPQFADVLFTPGGVLDPAKYYIVMPDAIGHGKSSKPSDGMHAKFPNYDYDDEVALQYKLLAEGLKIDHVRLIFGTSMGCMNDFVWGETYPTYMDGLMPMACLPVALVGRNRMWREMVMSAIRNDPDWKGGEYKTQPVHAMEIDSDMLAIAGSAPLQMQKSMPTAKDADDYVASIHKHDLATYDANDALYQLNASRNYDPSPKLSTITAPVLWMNSADDFVNPPELGIAEKEVAKLPHGRFHLIPIGENTHGHGSHSWAILWKDDLAQFLKDTEKKG